MKNPRRWFFYSFALRAIIMKGAMKDVPGFQARR